MLFARAYGKHFFERARIWDHIAENLNRPTSLWLGRPEVEGLPSLPRMQPEDFPESESDSPTTRPKHPFEGLGGQILPGLCAFACANSFDELARKIWENYEKEETESGDPINYAQWCEEYGVLVIFEGQPRGSDPSGNPLFFPEKIRLVGDLHAIRKPETTPPTTYYSKNRVSHGKRRRPLKLAAAR